MGYQHPIFVKQAHGRWSREETAVLIAEWNQLGRGFRGVGSDSLGLSFADWHRLANAVNTYRADNGLESIRTYDQCKRHLKYNLDKIIQKDSDGSTSAHAAAGKVRPAATVVDLREDFMDEDSGVDEELDGHSTATTVKVDVLGFPYRKRPRTGVSTFSSLARAASPSAVKAELLQPGNARRSSAVDEGRGQEAEDTHGAGTGNGYGAAAIGGFGDTMSGLLGVASRSSGSAAVCAAAEVLKVLAGVCRDVMVKSLEVRKDEKVAPAETKRNAWCSLHSFSLIL